MKTRVILSLVAATNTSAVQIRNAIDAALTGKPRYSDIRDPDAPPVIAVDTDGTRRVTTSLRFQSSADADAFYTQAQTEFNRTRVRAGSKISMHNCPHDNPEGEWYPCDAPQAAYQEQVK